MLNAANQPTAVDPVAAQRRNNDLQQQLNIKHLYTIDVSGDGNCFFRSLSVSMHGHQNEHGALRAAIACHIHKESDGLVGPDRDVLRQRAADIGKSGTWATEDIILAAADCLQRPIHVYVAAARSSPLVYSPTQLQAARSPLLLAFFEPGHYRSVASRQVTQSTGSKPPGNASSPATLNTN